MKIDSRVRVIVTTPDDVKKGAEGTIRSLTPCKDNRGHMCHLNLDDGRQAYVWSRYLELISDE